MEVFLHLVPVVLVAFLQVLLSPIFWVVILLVGFLHHRQAKMKEALFGARDYMPWHNTAMSLFFGLAGGLVGSFLMVFFGISLTGAGIGYLWLVAIALLLISPRYLCFSYAGGIISITSIFFGFPEIDVPQLMGLVAVLHMVEAMLIFASGHLGAVPIYTRNNRGELVGGFNLQCFWPLPLIALTVITQSGYTGSWLNMPDWWPLVKPAGNLENMLFALLPVLAALGYSDVAIANSPQEKGRHSALLLAVYSISLLGLSIVASHYRHLAIIPALFAPVAHEFTIVLGQNRELNGKPIYIHPEKGIMVLETIKGSIGSKMGLNTRDIILSINGMEVNNKCQVTEAVAIHGWWTEMEYRDSKTGEIKQRFTRKKVGEPLGIIFVPGPGDVANVKFNPDNSFISRIWPHKKDCQQSSTP